MFFGEWSRDIWWYDLGMPIATSQVKPPRPPGFFLSTNFFPQKGWWNPSRMKREPYNFGIRVSQGFSRSQPFDSCWFHRGYPAAISLNFQLQARIGVGMSTGAFGLGAVWVDSGLKEKVMLPKDQDVGFLKTDLFHIWNCYCNVKMNIITSCIEKMRPQTLGIQYIPGFMVVFALHHQKKDVTTMATSQSFDKNLTWNWGTLEFRIATLWYWGSDLEPGMVHFPTKWGAF